MNYFTISISIFAILLEHSHMEWMCRQQRRRKMSEAGRYIAGTYTAGNKDGLIGCHILSQVCSKKQK